MNNTTTNAINLEDMNEELFAAFNPEDELWVMGGSNGGSGSYTSGGDGGGDYQHDSSVA